ncbi:Hypothetical predicted protein [Lecanosticta acicola]|uniref:Uncharacterized protein n=1 Tax=Lecanosticta acicola TaxID=111012 RepID=A0AAI9EBU6_9PEZI|nr:Hypothetical predicted protein [Lecanosticta acicola]
MATLVTEWDAFQLLQIKNLDTHTVTCVGYAPSKRRRCQNPIAQHNRMAANEILQKLPRRALDQDHLYTHLERLAGLLLCRRNHQDQACTVATEWHRTVISQVNGRHRHYSATNRIYRNCTLQAFKTEQTSSCDDDWQEEISRLQRELEEAKRRQRAANAQRAYERQEEEAHRQARRERDQKDVEERRKPVQEEARQEEARRAEGGRRQQQQEQSSRAAEARQRREQEARAKAQQNDITWSEAWRRYEQRWLEIREMSEEDLAKISSGSLHWPVKSGKFQDVNEANVEAFLRNASDDVYSCREAYLKVLNGQNLRWHPDKIGRFSGLRGDDISEALFTLVAQVINRERDASRLKSRL